MSSLVTPAAPQAAPASTNAPNVSLHSRAQDSGHYFTCPAPRCTTVVTRHDTIYRHIKVKHGDDATRLLNLAKAATGTAYGTPPPAAAVTPHANVNERRVRKFRARAVRRAVNGTGTGNGNGIVNATDAGNAMGAVNEFGSVNGNAYRVMDWEELQRLLFGEHNEYEYPDPEIMALLS